MMDRQKQQCGGQLQGPGCTTDGPILMQDQRTRDLAKNAACEPDRRRDQYGVDGCLAAELPALKASASSAAASRSVKRVK